MINDNNFKIDKDKKIIYLVTTSVGYNLKNSVGISWHCKKDGSYLLYKKESDSSYIKVMPCTNYWSIEESYVEDSYQSKRYVCSVNLNNLDSKCKYVYQIVCEDIVSTPMTFTTSSMYDSKYSFMSFCDFQYSENETTINLVKRFINENPSVNLITCSGDIADEGYLEKSHRFLFDNKLFSNKILAFGCGDHEYWGSMVSPIKMLQQPYAYNKLFNNPKNGCDGYLNSSYYFKYNNLLFVFLNCGDSNVSYNNEMFSKQAIWLDEILTEEKDYEFIIVSMHKSLYGDIKQDSAIKKIAPIFIKVFDKYKVDLVISGHDHEYSRTKPLKNNEENDNGTIYLDLGSSGDKRRNTGESVKSDVIYDKYIDIKENSFSLGLVGTFENNMLSLEVRNQYYDIVDKVEINLKNR